MFGLCRIARKVETDKALSDCVVEYDGRIWEAESFLKNRWSEFMICLESIASDGCEDIKVIPNESSEYLEIVVSLYTSKSRTEKKAVLLGKLFPFIFENYRPEIVEKNKIANMDNFISESTHIIRTYMTTQVYDLLYSFHISQQKGNKENEKPLVLPDNFIPKLCKFQETTVRWLLQRERTKSFIPPMYVKLFAKDQIHSIYKHRWCFDLLNETEGESPIELPPGGILADEMGLGKTVETLALILLNVRKNIRCHSILEIVPPQTKKMKLEVFCICGRTIEKKLITCTICFTRQHVNCVRYYEKDDEKVDPYICPRCWEKATESELLETSGTFIVSPTIIKNQWVSEIANHVHPNLKVLVYNGLAANQWMSPLQLATYDIVITDYNVLRKDFYYAQINASDRKTRTNSSKMNLKSPLLMLSWWRVCLDEGQMIESNSSIAAQLARNIPAVNRWAVTGTPIQQSMEDLLPLFIFLRIPQFTEPIEAWNNLIYDFIANHEAPNKPLPLIKDVLSKCMWRTCKSKIENELKLPPQTVRVHRINLSLIEKIYYEDLHEECRQTFDMSVQSRLPWSTDDFECRTLSPKILKKVLLPVLRLRQCCTISVIQSGTSVPLKQFLQPNELQAHLKSSNEIECKSALRTIASSHNGIAGLFFLCERYDEACNHYLNVLELADKYKDYGLAVDSLLQIHALYNLILANNATDSPTITSEAIANYQKKLDSLEWKYIEPYVNQLNSAKHSYESLRQEATQHEAFLTFNLCDLLKTVSDIIATYKETIKEAIYNRAVLEFERHFFTNELPENVQNYRDLINYLMCWASEMNRAREKLTKAFENLQFFTQNLRIRTEILTSTWSQMSQFISSVYDCHLSETRESKVDPREAQEKQQQRKKCALCIIQTELLKYECLLFDKVYDAKTEQTDGHELPSGPIFLLKGLLTGLKIRIGPLQPIIIKEYEKHMKLVEFIQSLCKKMSKYWIEIEYAVKVYDELDMCKMRISFAKDEDDVSNFRIMPTDVEKELGIHYFNMEDSKADFDTKFARLKYIINFHRTSEEMTCPICTSDECTEYSVLECGHFTCVECYKTSCKFTTSEYITCSVCRHKQTKQSIHLLTRNKGNEFHNTEYSAKIAFIIQVIWELQKAEGKPKILIFSEWEPILKALSKALLTNQISFRLHRKPEDLFEFKDLKKEITCLLMLLKKGSKGINLIEATHVFLVEPILNPAEELQAIGRVHRIGQTKPTTVHRFIVNKTIEEKIFDMVLLGNDESESKWDFENITVSKIKSLFDRDT